MAEIAKSKQRQRKMGEAYYKNQFFNTEKNKTRWVLRHYRSHPTDQVAATYLQAKNYKLADVQLTGRGRKLLARAA